MPKELTTHASRCLGALAALTEQNESKIRFFCRLDIGRIVYDRSSGVHLKTMLTLGRAGLVAPENATAVDLVSDKICTCGCDRWCLTDAGREKVVSLNVKVPHLPKPRPRLTSIGDEF